LPLVAVALPSPATAQTDNSTLFANWQKEKGVYLTEPVKRQFPQYQASLFSDKAAGLGSENKDALTAALRESRVKLFPGGAHGSIAFTDHIGNVTHTQPVQGQETNYIASLFSWSTFSAFLEKFATVHLTVQPAPPRDYKVEINGDDCDATDQGLYVVMPGRTTVDVTRPQKPACNWSGEIGAGKTQLVNCQL
jgi:hypothetical protein